MASCNKTSFAGEVHFHIKNEMTLDLLESCQLWHFPSLRILRCCVFNFGIGDFRLSHLFIHCVFPECGSILCIQS